MKTKYITLRVSMIKTIFKVITGLLIITFIGMMVMAVIQVIKGGP